MIVEKDYGLFAGDYGTFDYWDKLCQLGVTVVVGVTGRTVWRRVGSVPGIGVAAVKSNVSDWANERRSFGGFDRPFGASTSLTYHSAQGPLNHRSRHFLRSCTLPPERGRRLVNFLVF